MGTWAIRRTIGDVLSHERLGLALLVLGVLLRVLLALLAFLLCSPILLDVLLAHGVHLIELRAQPNLSELSMASNSPQHIDDVANYRTRPQATNHKTEIRLCSDSAGERCGELQAPVD
eukprot:scaffold470643_cov38-Prasinocladus_malaysianus.AAC.1